MDAIIKQAKIKIKEIIEFGGTEDDLMDLVELCTKPLHNLDIFLAKAGEIEVDSKYNMGYCQCLIDVKRAVGYTDKEHKDELH